MSYGALWLWSQPSIHTISIGAESPGEMREHIETACTLLGQEGTAEAIQGVGEGLRALEEEAGYDAEWRSTWWHGLPTCYETESGLNIPHIVWLYMLYESYDMLWYTRERYNALEKGQAAKGWKKKRNPWAKFGDWTPGRDGSKAQGLDIATLLQERGSPYPERIAGIVLRAHRALGKGGVEARAAAEGQHGAP